jgi:hypothetical protein
VLGDDLRKRDAGAAVQNDWWFKFSLSLFAISFVLNWIVTTKLRHKQVIVNFFGYFLRISLAILIWTTATLFAATSIASYIRPKQDLYLFSGSDVTFWPALIFGLVAAWIVIGPEEPGDDSSRFSSADKRWVALVSLVWWAAKALLWIALAGLAFVILIWVGEAASDRIAQMSNSEAILLGAIVIAYAIYASAKARR